MDNLPFRLRKIGSSISTSPVVTTNLHSSYAAITDLFMEGVLLRNQSNTFIKYKAHSLTNGYQNYSTARSVAIFLKSLSTISSYLKLYSKKVGDGYQEYFATTNCIYLKKRNIEGITEYVQLFNVAIHANDVPFYYSQLHYASDYSEDRISEDNRRRTEQYFDYSKINVLISREFEKPEHKFLYGKFLKEVMPGFIERGVTVVYVNSIEDCLYKEAPEPPPIETNFPTRREERAFLATVTDELYNALRINTSVNLNPPVILNPIPPPPPVPEDNDDLMDLLEEQDEVNDEAIAESVEHPIFAEDENEEDETEEEITARIDAILGIEEEPTMTTSVAILDVTQPSTPIIPTVEAMSPEEVAQAEEELRAAQETAARLQSNLAQGVPQTEIEGEVTSTVSSNVVETVLDEQMEYIRSVMRQATPTADDVLFGNSAYTLGVDVAGEGGQDFSLTLSRRWIPSTENLYSNEAITEFLNNERGNEEARTDQSRGISEGGESPSSQSSEEENS